MSSKRGADGQIGEGVVVVVAGAEGVADEVAVLGGADQAAAALEESLRSLLERVLHSLRTTSSQNQGRQPGSDDLKLAILEDTWREAAKAFLIASSQPLQGFVCSLSCLGGRGQALPPG